MERVTDHKRDADPRGPVVDPRVALAAWLRGGRARRKMSVDDVARVTKIQPRFLEKLEAGQIRCAGDGMPAEVFVRGFVRSFARCVGLDEAEALERYMAIERGQDHPVARALVETMLWEPPAEAAPVPLPVAMPDASGPMPVAVAVEPSPLEAAPVDAAPAKKKRAPRKKPSATGAPPRSRKKKSTSPPLEASASDGLAEVAPPVAAEPAPTVEPASEAAAPAIEAAAPVEATTTSTWTPTMPSPAAVVPTVPWRRPSFVPAAPPLPNLPSLVIDDADPDRAERVQHARAREHRRTFLPPILLDRDDRSANGSQRGLTLAVIILLVAATLTLSYLMRRPSSSGDGVTSIDRDRIGERAA